MAIRGIDHRDSGILLSMNPPKPKSPKVMRALKALAGKKWPADILVKFGKRKYMAELLLAGRGRLSPATSYDDQSLGYARADSESCVAAYVDPADAYRFMAVSHEQAELLVVGYFEIKIPGTRTMVFLFRRRCCIRE